MSDNRPQSLLTQQIDYYRARAPEYDQWFLRQGRYDRGQEHCARWQREVEIVQSALAAFNPTGRVLELAAGTGWWTRQLHPFAGELVAVDAVAETLAINRSNLPADDRVADVSQPEQTITFVQADIFSLTPDVLPPGGPFDVIFFSFWLSHVPPARLAEFWAMLRRFCHAQSRVFLVDSLYHPESTARDNVLPDQQETVVTRTLNDGSSYEIVKVFYTPETLSSGLRELGWGGTFQATESFFLYGSAQPDA